MEQKEPWGFCETPEEKCTANYCDDNGCQNRKRVMVIGSGDYSLEAGIDYIIKEQIKKSYTNYLNTTTAEDFYETLDDAMSFSFSEVKEGKTSPFTAKPNIPLLKTVLTKNKREN